MLLRGGSEALESNTLLAAVLGKAVEKAGLPADAIQVVETADRAAVMAMLTLDRYLDLIIPRGGEEFVRLVAERATVPVLKHDKGLCHVYVDAGADLDMAVAIAVNAKAQRLERVQRARDAARARRDRRPPCCRGSPRACAEAGVEVRARRARAGPRARSAGRRAGRLGHGVPRLHPRGPGGRGLRRRHRAHPPARLGARRGHRHLRPRGARAASPSEVDAAAVLVNASTRLVDGSQFGMGAEMGISTSRLHARGPVGVRELTTTKFVVWGDGQVRE